MKKIALALLASFGVLAVLFFINPQIKPSHSDSFLALSQESQAAAPAETDIMQRVLLFGDAGHSTLEPWQASLALLARRASISPGKTAVVALGDNIYMRGYPQKEDGQEDWDEDQLESISFLDAQLKVAKESGAAMYFVPGNHDWYATEIDSQAEHIARFATDNQLAARLEPWEKGQRPLPESVDLPGVSLVFIDSEWLLYAEEDSKRLAYQTLDSELARIRAEHPDNLILVGQHHPLLTEGPHGGYLSDFSYWLLMNILYLVTDVAAKEDTYDPNYQRMIKAQNDIFARYDRLIHASGHEHSLQVFQAAPRVGADYLIVSGAANSNKVSGVWHNERTRFAQAREGFVELAITATGVYLQVFTIDSETAVAGFWLQM